MLEGIDLKQRINFIPSKDKTEPKTVFVLKPLSSIEMLSMNKGDNSLFKYLKESIVSINNFCVDNIEEAIHMLDTKTIEELLTEINKLNKISEEEEKNS
jgi:hypothetical protein